MTTALRQYLEAGGRPEDVPGFGIICDEYVDTELGFGRFNEPEAWLPRHRAAMTEPAPHPNWRTDDRWQRWNAAMVDLFEDQETRRAFWDAMAPGTRAALEGRIELTKRPVALSTDEKRRSLCNGCGAVIQEGERRLEVETKDPRQFAMDDRLVLCVPCLYDAAVGVDQFA